MLFENHYEGWDSRAEEDVGGKPDDGVNVVLLYELAPDLAFASIIRISSEEHAVRKDNGHYSIGIKMMEFVQKEGVVSL